MRQSWRALFVTVVVLAAGRAQAQHTIRVQFYTSFNDACVVRWNGGAMSARPGGTKSGVRNGSYTYDGSFNAPNPGPNINFRIVNTGGYPYEAWGGWSINARCVVSLDGREIGNQVVTGYFRRNRAWEWNAPTGLGGPASAALPPQPPPPPPAPPVAPTMLGVSSQLQLSLQNSLTSSSPFLGPGDSLTSTSPFTMPIGNNLSGRSTQALGYGCDPQLIFQQAYGRAPTLGEAAGVGQLCIVAQGYINAFGRMPGMGATGELHYWSTTYPKLTLAELEGVNSNWLRSNAAERAATIRRAFAAVGRQPTPADLAQWNATVAQHGTLFTTIVAQLKAQPSSHPAGPAGDTLWAGGSMRRGQALVSQNGLYRAIYQTDGNLVVYRGTQPLWNTYTYNRPSTELRMQTDGNLVLYLDNAQGTPMQVLWSTRTYNRGGNRLVMQNDGKLVIFGPNGAVWATGS